MNRVAEENQPRQEPRRRVAQSKDIPNVLRKSHHRRNFFYVRIENVWDNLTVM